MASAIKRGEARGRERSISGGVWHSGGCSARARRQGMCVLRHVHHLNVYVRMFARRGEMSTRASLVFQEYDHQAEHRTLDADLETKSVPPFDGRYIGVACLLCLQTHDPFRDLPSPSLQRATRFHPQFISCDNSPLITPLLPLTPPPRASACSG
jgi:hypothetical protein